VEAGAPGERSGAVIAVIGGGISGLAVAYHLDRAGREFRVLESAAAAGGVIASAVAHGQVLDLGPQRTRLTPALRRLVSELGLDGRLQLAPDLPLYIYAGGRLRRVPMDARGALTADALRWRDRARVLLEPLTGPLDPDETAADFFIRKFGRGTYDRVLGPLFGGLYGSDPATMPARHALAPVLRALGVRRSVLAALARTAGKRDRMPACSFDGGLQVLTDALAARLGPRLELGTRARGIHRHGERLVVVHDRGELEAEAVVLACPADAAARVLDTVEPETAGRLAGLRYNPLAVVHLLADGELLGYGYQVALTESSATHGVASNQAMFGRPGLHTAFLGGAGRLDIAGLSDDAVGRLAAAELERMCGLPGTPIHVHRTRMPAWDASWSRLDGLSPGPGIHICANWWGRPGMTARLGDAERLAVRLAAGRSTRPGLVRVA
jgi:protoporphyrinogen/coproporphyrinogen III oxidase